MRDEGVHGPDLPDLMTSDRMTEQRLVEFIEERGGKYGLREIEAEFGNPSKDYSPDYLDILRRLIDDGTVPCYSMTKPS